MKDLRTVWIIGCQLKTYYLCCSLFLLFRQSFISVAGCRFKPSRWIGNGFRVVYSPTEEETAPNGLPLDLFIFQVRFDYLCIRQKGETDEVLLYNEAYIHVRRVVLMCRKPIFERKPVSLQSKLKIKHDE